MDKITKLEKLLRYHRQHVFDDNGDLHGKAIDRLKRTRTFKAMANHNQENQKRLWERRMNGMGY